ncbi:hypothetical protein SISSUDRAFT_571788 [Sistotremastrum suecicum HHB10207 ss-3]|uniref:MYND-type domain-containing protein n=1 Tax=Sistotremastrum suecicum HHB10207 ss-3 TaxID=1314776 RepID=A0A166ERF5_9AGAM|nr:hypothetical protein SISSUDRAFT_571788 [Sistotremastrum suecicum HHB10207 ss-3]
MYGFQCLACLESWLAVIRFRDTVAEPDFCRIGVEMANIHPGMDYFVLSSHFHRKSSVYPFDTWGDALPHMADILRSNSEFDSADILDLKYLLYCGKADAVREMAENAARRRPEIGFWYYALALAATGNIGDVLKQIREHLQNDHLSVDQRFHLLCRYSSIALHFVVNELRSSRPAEPMWDETLSLLAFWYESLRAAVNDAAPDTPNLSLLVSIVSLFHILIHGPKLRPNFCGTELRSVVQHYDFIMTIHEFFMSSKASDCVPSVERKIETFFLDNIVSSTSKWNSLIKRTNSCVWAQEERERMSLKPSGLGITFVDGSPHADPTKMAVLDAANRRRMHLYNCSWCLNPSAVMRKCAVCESTRYCDKECQKRDWKAHKKVCKSQEITI